MAEENLTLGLHTNPGRPQECGASREPLDDRPDSESTRRIRSAGWQLLSLPAVVLANNSVDANNRVRLIEGLIADRAV
jgi:hypothetical protein